MGEREIPWGAGKAPPNLHPLPHSPVHPVKLCQILLKAAPFPVTTTHLIAAVPPIASSIPLQTRGPFQPSDLCRGWGCCHAHPTKHPHAPPNTWGQHQGTAELHSFTEQKGSYPPPADYFSQSERHTKALCVSAPCQAGFEASALSPGQFLPKLNSELRSAG